MAKPGVNLDILALTQCCCSTETVLASHTIFQAATLKNEIGEMNVLI